MATIDLADLVPDLEASVSVPGIASPFAAASEEEWLTRLRNGFWEAYNDGLISGYICDEDGLVTGDTAMGRDLQQICILYAAMNIIRNQILQLKTLFRSKAGPVEYEVQQSASAFKSILDSMLAQKEVILRRLQDGGNVDTYYIDAVRSRDYSLRSDLIEWSFY